MRTRCADLSHPGGGARVAAGAGGPAAKGLLGPMRWIGAAVWPAGFVFETVGDFRLSRFRGDPAHRGQVTDRGLWRYNAPPVTTRTPRGREGSFRDRRSARVLY